METKHLKKYAPEARRDFIAAVKNKAAVYGLLPKEILPMQEEGDVVIIGDRPFPRSVAKQRNELEARIRKEGFQQFIEAIAYTWFNRFVAIRYMELHGYLDHGYRVLSHPEGKSAPEILENAERVELPGLKRDEVVDLKLDGGKDEQLYQMLLLAQCNALHKAMPFLFESIKDGTELLLPDNLLHTDSLVRTLVNDIPEEQWENVEIIGWLYQFYISEKKDEVIGKVVKSEDIPAATQLFTPNWIVRYMLHNTLGRKWMATYPDSPLKQQMEFYIEPASQTAEVQQQLNAITPDSLNPEELTLLDPACGSGHILVEAYDLFKAIYEERGYRARDIPKLILTRNLFGLEIDDRAAQLAAFALMMKARADDRGVFSREVELQVVSIQESKGLDAKDISEAVKGDIAEADLAHLIELFEYGKTYGSLIHVPDKLAEKLADIDHRVEDLLAHGGMFGQAAARTMKPLIRQALMLSGKFAVVVMNPPYLSAKGLPPALKSFLKPNFAEGAKDLFAAFILRGRQLATTDAELGFMSPFTWMFIGSFAKLRSLLLDRTTPTTLIQLEYSGFAEATVPICTFTFHNSHLACFRSTFIKLSDFRGPEVQPQKTLEAITNRQCGWLYELVADQMSEIPDSPFAFWVGDATRRAFRSFPALTDFREPQVGLQTSNTDRFIRFWAEVDLHNTRTDCADSEEAQSSGSRWFPLDKGGSVRRWYGNKEFLVNWYDNGREVKEYVAEQYPYLKGNTDYVVKDRGFFFRPGVTWNKITSADFSARLSDVGAIFSDAGMKLPCESGEELMFFTALLNSCVVRHFLRAMSPTLNCEKGAIEKIPVARPGEPVARLAEACTAIAKADWDAIETSWEFQSHQYLTHGRTTVHKSQEAIDAERLRRVVRMKELEDENNRLFIEAYGLQDELSPEVPEEQITLCRPDPEDDIKQLLSFAIGCMMGRYSLDEPGLIYAHSGNAGFDSSRYSAFPADEDGIIPITDMEWFPDDAANRFEQFIKTAWPVEHLEENLKFVADRLDQKKGETSRDCIRRYLATGFYKHHMSMYKKRPIYWLFSSGKQRAFQCLVYLHRYNAGTLSRMRTEYVVKLQGKVNARIEQLESDIPSAGSTSHRKKLERERDTLIKQREELQTFDEKLRHYADQRIELDLDDGVKVNYGKFGDLLAEVKAITGEKPKVEVVG